MKDEENERRPQLGSCTWQYRGDLVATGYLTKYTIQLEREKESKKWHFCDEHCDT